MEKILCSISYNSI